MVGNSKMAANKNPYAECTYKLIMQFVMSSRKTPLATIDAIIKITTDSIGTSISE